MNTYIALLRGINVGGHNKVPMAELRELLTKAGLENVTSYIQSGNVIFDSTEKNKNKLEQLISKAIFSHFNFKVPVLVKTREDIQTMFNDCPFPEDKKTSSYFTILSDRPNSKLIEEASQKVYPEEEFKIINDCIYFYSDKGYGNVKYNLNYFERKLNVNATSRNYKTMVKLLSLSQK